MRLIPWCSHRHSGLRVPGLVLIALCFFVEAVKGDPDGTYLACTSWTPYPQWPCPLEDDPVAALEILLDRGLAGQTLAALSIRKALAQNNEKFKKGRVRKRDRLASMLTLPFSPPAEATSKTSQRKTLFLHFSGPTGVGKSLTAGLVAQSLFAPGGRDCGVLVVNLNQFRALKQWQEEAAIADLLRSFRDQLRQCPRSVFILDELQSVTPALVAALVSSFQPPAASWPHGIVGAFPIVILISDLGSERLGANMTRTEAVVEISAVASARFLGEGAGANSASTASVLHNNLVPFLPLSLEDLSKVAAMQLQVLQTQLRAEFGGSWVGKLTWHPRAAAQLARICFGDAACYQEGGRGVESKVQHELQTEVEALVGACLERAERAQRAPGEVWGAEVCSDNVDVDVQVSEEGEAMGGGHEGSGQCAGEGCISAVVDGLVLVLDAVYGHSEFEGYAEEDGVYAEAHFGDGGKSTGAQGGVEAGQGNLQVALGEEGMCRRGGAGGRMEGGYAAAAEERDYCEKGHYETAREAAARAVREREALGMGGGLLEGKQRELNDVIQGAVEEGRTGQVGERKRLEVEAAASVVEMETRREQVRAAGNAAAGRRLDGEVGDRGGLGAVAKAQAEAGVMLEEERVSEGRKGTEKEQGSGDEW